MWKTILLLLLAISTVGHAAEPKFYTGLADDAVIESATTFMDGGSISLTLRDGRRRRVNVSYKSAWIYGRKEGGGQLTFFPPSKKRYDLTPNSPEEKSALRLISTAAQNTYGTSDPEALKEGAKNQDGKLQDWTRYAVGTLFRHIINRNREEQAAKRK